MRVARRMVVRRWAMTRTARPRARRSRAATTAVFGGGVEGGRGFVKNKNGGVFQEGAGEGEALAFAAGEGGAAFADDGFVALREALDKLVGLSGLGGGFNFGAGRARASVCDVLGNGEREKERLLGDDGDVAAEAGELEGAEVAAVEQDAAAPGIEEARDEGGEGAFPGAGGADEGDDFSGGDFQADTAQHGLAGLIAEGDVFKLDAALDGNERHGAGLVHEIVFCVKNFADALGAAGGALDGGGGVHDGGERLVKGGEIGKEKENGAHAGVAGEGLAAADPEDEARADGGGQANEELETELHVGQPGGGADGLAAGFGKGVVGGRLAGEGLNDGDGGKGLLGDLVDAGFLGLLRGAEPGHRVGVKIEDDDHEGDDGEGEERQGWVQAPEEGEHGGEGEERGDHRQGGAGDNDGDAGAIGGRAAEVVADGFGGVKAQGQLLEFGKKIGGEIIDHALAEVNVGVRCGRDWRPN